MRSLLLRLIKRLIRTSIAEELIEFYKLSEWVKLSKQFKSIGSSCNVVYPFIIKNPQYISIGNNFSALRNVRIEAYDKSAAQLFVPEIIIGNDVCFNTDVHIGCIDKIIIGNSVLMASRIYISDHSHGNVNVEALALPPLNRPLVSKGPVIIEDNVWIGEGVCILPGVTIGRNSIIGANSVVTKSVPENSVVVGIPSRVIKTLSN